MRPKLNPPPVAMLRARSLRTLTISFTLLMLLGKVPAAAQTAATCLQGWDWKNVTSAYGGPAIVGQPSAITWNQGEHGRRDDVFARGYGGDLIHYFRFEGSNWQPGENLTTLAPGSHRIQHDPVSILGRQTVNGKKYSRHDVFAVGFNEDLIHYWWSEEPPSGWHSENLTTRYGGHSVWTQPEVRNSNYLDSSGNRSLKTEVYSTDLAGNLIRYLWTREDGWDSSDITQNTGGAGLLALRGISATDGGSSSSSHHVFGTSPSGHLIDYFWSPTAGWQRQNLTLLGGLQTSPLVTSMTALPSGYGSALEGGIFGFHSGSLVRYWSRNLALPWNSENVTAGIGFLGSPEPVIGRPTMSRSRQLSGPTPPIETYERYDVFARDIRGDLVHYWSHDSWAAFSSSNGFVSWQPGESLTAMVGGTPISSDPLFVVRANSLWDSEHYVFARSGDSLVSYCWSSAEGWAAVELQLVVPVVMVDGMEQIGEPVAGDPTLTQYSTSGMSLYAASPTGDFLHYWKP